ncbi:kinase-like protein, partial [Lepidopterella palustris CBS 459.81]
MDTKAIIRDNVFPHISELLKRFGQVEWSLRPRTFCILRMLGCVDAMNAFIAEKRTDFFLPYNEKNLPHAIKGADMRAKFLRFQKLVLSPHHLNELEQEDSAHLHFHNSADDYFSYIKDLGLGKFGVVDHVHGTISLRQYARKRIHRGASALKDCEMLDQFEHELIALKALTHRHLVKLVSSYTDPFFVGLIMTPVADEDLHVFLKRTLNGETERSLRKQRLRIFFGCLSSALDYLHANKIRHKDIKSRNVLVKGSKVLLTDFGTAMVCNDNGQSTSVGPVTVWTPKYSAPEVATLQHRGKSSDIWSLGCVFLEMATVLNDRSLDEMTKFYLENGSHYQGFWGNEEATKNWINELKGDIPKSDAIPLEWISWMLKPAPDERPTSPQLLGCILDIESEFPFLCSLCRA